MYREPRANLNQKSERNLPGVCGHESLFHLSSVSKIAILGEREGEHPGQMKKTSLRGFHFGKGRNENAGRLKGEKETGRACGEAGTQGRVGTLM